MIKHHYDDHIIKHHYDDHMITHHCSLWCHVALDFSWICIIENQSKEFMVLAFNWSYGWCIGYSVMHKIHKRISICISFIFRQENNNQVQPLFNFQKASCTLDASIKIYSNRVDDTWNSSYKILENLTRSDESKTRKALKWKW